MDEVISRAGNGMNSSVNPTPSTTICQWHKIEVPVRVVGTGVFETRIPVCPKCQEAAEQFARIDEQNWEARIAKETEARIKKGIPKLFFDAKLADFKNIEPVHEWIAKKEGFLVIISPCGRGKSRLACAITMELRKIAVSCSLVFSSDLFLALRNSFNREGPGVQSEKQIIDALVTPPTLVVDDIGVQKQSEYAIESWYSIIDTRYRNCLPTVFTSNLSMKEISQCMGDRIASRLMSGKVFMLPGQDRRVGA